MEFGLKWVHMARYELILKLDGALWLTITSKPLLTPPKAMKDPKNPKESQIRLVLTFHQVNFVAGCRTKDQHPRTKDREPSTKNCNPQQQRT